MTVYRKKGLVEGTRWTPGMDLTGVTVNELDRDAGSPRDGDMIFHDPNNPKDRWLVSAAYFEKNYEQVT
jgi:hypothetical protein